MDSSLYNAWVHNDHHRLQQGADWQKNQVSAGLNEFQSLNDISATASSPAPTPSTSTTPQTSFFAGSSYGVQNANSSLYMPYQSNAIPYNQLGSWNQRAQQPQQLGQYLPNGSTSGTTPSNSPAGSMNIDPSLTLSHGSTSPAYSAASTLPSPQKSVLSQSQPPQQHQQQQPSQTFEVLIGEYLRSQQQQQPPQPLSQPTSLSPQTIFQEFSQQTQNQPQQQLTPFYQQQSQIPSQSTSSTATSPSTSFVSPSALQQSQYQVSTPPQPQVLQLRPPQTQPPKPPLLPAIKSLLVPTSFTGAGAVIALITKITSYGVADVDLATRMEILTKIRDSAGNPYFRAWSENPEAIDVTREWLRAGFAGASDKEDEAGNSYSETIMPLLHIIDRLPITLENLKASKLGKLIVKLVKDPPSPAIKDMAANIERRWRDLVTQPASNATKMMAAEASGEGPATKKRKLAQTKSSTAGNADLAREKGVKRQAIASSTNSSKPAVKKEPTKDAAKSDSSFFSSRPTKQKLPSFKKAPPGSVTAGQSSSIGAAASGIKKEEQNVSKPSTFDAFADVLKSMNNKKPASQTSAPIRSPPRPTTPMTIDSPPPQVASGSSTTTARGKKRKSVTWAPDSQLENVKIIERAIYENEHEIPHHISSLKDLDRGEGAALHAHLFEETIDWAEPSLIEIPSDITLTNRGTQSVEKGVQEAREQTALATLYMSAEQIPLTAMEPSHVIADGDVDTVVKHMQVGPDAEAVFWSAQVQTPPTQQAFVESVGYGETPGMNGSVEALLANTDTAGALAGATPDQVQLLLSLLQSSSVPVSGGGSAGNPQGGFGNGGWDQHLSHQPTSYGGGGEYGQGSYSGGDVDDASRWGDGAYGGTRGRGGAGRSRGRGRGGGRGRKPCTFYLAGRCKYGEQCDFLHEYPS